MKKLLTMILAVVLLLSGCSNKKQRYDATSTTSGFDTAIQLISYQTSQKKFDRWNEEMKTLFQQYNDLFDRYNNVEGMNNLKTINDNAGIAPVVVDEKLMALLLEARDLYDLVPQFNITIGALTELWRVYREQAEANDSFTPTGAIPSDDEIKKALSCSGWQHVTLDTTASTVYIDDPCVSLDVGSIGKGYAAEQIAKTLSSEGLTNAIINAGQSSIRSIANKPGDEPWTVGLSEPRIDMTSYLKVVRLQAGMSLVTSGDYQRYFYGPDGTMYHHLLDPATGYPARNFRAISIVASDNSIADALSTALFVMTFDEGMAFITTYNQTHDPIEVSWIVDADDTRYQDWEQIGDYRIYMTDGLKVSVVSDDK